MCLLSRRFNPKTPARILQSLTAVLSPPPVKDVRLLERAIEEWESKRSRLKSEFNESFSDNVSIAILTTMLSRDLQDMVFQQGKMGEALTYKDVRDKVMSVASHRAHQATPAPMDVGCVGDGEHPDNQWGCEDCQDVDAVTKATCYECGGWGHLARDCATRAAKGKGKSKGETTRGGGKMGGKGAVSFTPGKGGPNTPGKGAGPGKGGGKAFGYQGTCYACGVVGHKAAECPWRQQHVQEVAREAPTGSPPQPPADDSTRAVSSVWCINAVSRVAEQPSERCSASSCGPQGLLEGWQVVRGRWRKTETLHRTATCNRRPFEVSAGSFGVLGESEVMERERDEAAVWVCPVIDMKSDAQRSERDICGVTTEITVDSAAEESVCPFWWAEDFGMKAVEPGKEMKFVNASGGRIAHWGARRVQVRAAGLERPLDIGFQVTDVKKPLLSVRRLCEQGNVVQFGRESGHSFVKNLETGDCIPLERRGNSWVIPSEFAQPRHF